VPSFRFPQLHVRSLRTRFGLWVAALVLVVVAVFGTYLYIDMGRGLRSALDDSLRVSASLASSTISVVDGRLVLGESTPGQNSELQVLLGQGDTVKYLDANGSVLGGFGLHAELPTDPTTLTAAQNGIAAFSDTSDPVRDRDYRAYTVPVLAGQTVVGFVQVLHDLEPVTDTLERLLGALLIGGAVISVGGGLVGYFLAGRALAPIDAITKTARRISGRDLSARLSLPGTDDEVGRLASTFNDMLERLEASFQRERRFTADASHELRTPLAAMEAILGVIRSERREPEEYEQALDDLAEETTRLRSLVESLLELAREARPAGTQWALVDISALVEDVVDALRPLAEAKSLSLESRAAPGLTVDGDGDSLVRLLLNLVENAIKFTEQGGITVSAASRNGSVVVEVTDTGIGIAPDELPQIFERFHRSDSSRSTRGMGLGLSLARQIAENHAGTLTVRSREGEGSTFIVTLQRDPRRTDSAG